MRTLADGQLAAAAATIFTGGQDANYPSEGNLVATLSLCNTSGANTETCTITFKRQGGTARRIARVVLSPNETARISGIPMQMGDVLLGAATDATTVDYVLGVSGISSFAVEVFDANGSSKQVAGATITAATTITSASANALAVGRQGTTTPALNVDASSASSVTGLNVVAAAAASGLALAVTSSGANENMTVDAKGSGTITFGATSTGAIQFSRAAVPTANDGSALGTTALQWADLFLAEGGVINWDNGDATITQTNNVIAVAGITDLTMDAVLRPATNDLGTLGSTTVGWSDLHLATGGVINWANGEVTITETDANTLTLAGATTLAVGATNITMTGSLAATGARLTKWWATDGTSTNALVVDSSETVKHDIAPYRGDALDIVNRMDVITFKHNDWLDPSGRTKMGLRAESVDEPMAVSQIERPEKEGGGTYPGVNQYSLETLLVRAVQQLSKEVRDIATTLKP